jgi:hypothetical protein
MAIVSITATTSELLQLSKAVKFAVSDKPDNRRHTLVLNDAPGGGSTWAVTDPQGNVKRG